MSLKNFSWKDVALFISAFILVLAVFLFIRSGQKETAVQPTGLSKIKISVSVPPLDNLVSSVAGDRADVQLIDSQKIDPREFIPLSKDTEGAFNSDLVFGAGAGLDDWVKDLKIEGARTYLLSDFVSNGSFSYKFIIGQDGRLAEISLPPSPYVWLSLRNAQTIIQNIARILGQTDPLNKEYYLNNAYDANFRIGEIYKKYLSEMAGLKKEKFLVFGGDAWEYLLEEMGLENGGAVVGYKKEGLSEDFPSNLAYSINKKTDKIFLDAGFFEETKDFLKEKISAYFGKLDPFGIYPAKNYADFMDDNLSEILKILKAEN